MRHPRYEVRSVTGYSSGGSNSPPRPSTTWWVADTWNCYRECDLWRLLGGKVVPARGKTTMFRSCAERTAEKLNREHDEWLASG